MLRIFRKLSTAGLLSSQLYDNETFYRGFERDLRLCQREAVIESPFITTRRLSALLTLLQKLNKRGVRVVVNTKPPQELQDSLYYEALRGIEMLQNAGVEVFYTGGHHRKLAILDRQILWEGSLNILSQNDSCEIMRRIDSADQAAQMLAFTKLAKFL